MSVEDLRKQVTAKYAELRLQGIEDAKLLSKHGWYGSESK